MLSFAAAILVLSFLEDDVEARNALTAMFIFSLAETITTFAFCFMLDWFPDWWFFFSCSFLASEVDIVTGWLVLIWK